MGMENDIKQFLIKIMQSISIVLLWMLLNVFFGIYKNYAFFDTMPNWENYLYYFLFLISLILLIFHLRNKWKA
jgi:hypothetical protein